MNKYLNIFAAILLSALTFSFTSCDKDDEPDSGSKDKGVVGELTIDGQKKSFVYITGEPSDDWFVKYTAAMYTKRWEDVIIFETSIDIKDLKVGMTLNENMAFLLPFMYEEVISGSVHVDKKTEDSFTLTFDKAIFKEWNGSKTVMFEGTIKLPINGEYGDALSSMK